jgi:hypothetical protein
VKRKIAEQKIESEDPESTGPAEKEMQKTEPYSVPIARKLAGER